MVRLVAVCGFCLLLGSCVSRPPPAPPPPPASAPVKIIGASAADLRGLFGAPAFVRKENSDEMWRYDGNGCRAFFFLYSQGGAQIVRYVETAPPGADGAADADCLNALRADRPVS
jgi:hypothetical protein